MTPSRGRRARGLARALTVSLMMCALDPAIAASLATTDAGATGTSVARATEPAKKPAPPAAAAKTTAATKADAKPRPSAATTKKASAGARATQVAGLGGRSARGAAFANASAKTTASAKSGSAAGKPATKQTAARATQAAKPANAQAANPVTAQAVKPASAAAKPPANAGLTKVSANPNPAATAVKAAAATRTVEVVTRSAGGAKDAGQPAVTKVTDGKAGAKPAAGKPAGTIARSSAHLDDQVTYQYNALGRRDPFSSLLTGEYVGADVGGGAPPDVGGLKVVGIVWGDADQFALVEDVRGDSHMLRRGDKVMNGYVEALKRDAVIVNLTVDGQTQSVSIPLTRKGEKTNANR